MTSPSPGLPVPAPLINPSSIYLLYYRHGSNPNCVKYFFHEGSLSDAHEIGREHCNLMGFHFVFVKPFLSNLKEDERRKLRTFGTSTEVVSS